LEILGSAWGKPRRFETELNVPLGPVDFGRRLQSPMLLEVVLSLERTQAEVRSERIVEVLTVPFEIGVELVGLRVDERTGEVFIIRVGSFGGLVSIGRIRLTLFETLLGALVRFTRFEMMDRIIVPGMASRGSIDTVRLLQRRTCPRASPRYGVV
jgi:hypothetical protein